MQDPVHSGLVGFLFDTSLDGADRSMDICEMAYELRKRIWCKLRTLKMHPDNPVEIDGEVWAPERLTKALMDLYDWTFKACANETQAVAIIGGSARCGKPSCNG